MSEMFIVSNCNADVRCGGITGFISSKSVGYCRALSIILLDSKKI
jgi:hypothetical protein